MQGSRIVVPSSLRDKVVQLAHEGHQGVTKTKEYLQTRVWFPGLDRIVEAHIWHCHPCQAVTPANERAPLRMSPLSELTLEESGHRLRGTYQHR